MREADKKFAYIEPSMELYKAFTSKYQKLSNRPAPAIPCCVKDHFEHFIESNIPYRILYFREKGSRWKKQTIHFVCAKHYKEITGEDLK